MAEPNTLYGSLRELLTGGAGRPASPVVTGGAASVAPVLPQQPVQQETSLLEQLRQSLQRDLTPGPMSSQDRLATFGRGVLSNRGSFLDNLSAGLAAQNQAEAGRREEGRKGVCRGVGDGCRACAGTRQGKSQRLSRERRRRGRL